ncbi:hypothetical protein ACWA1F_12550 [Flavobacterium sp. 3-218]
MEIEEKLNKLLAEKFFPNISILRDSKEKIISILDSQNGSTLIISHDSLFAFTDAENETWVNIPEKLIINGVRHYPKIGDAITGDGLKYYFTTKEIVIDMAWEYFKRFIDKHFGILVRMESAFFRHIEGDVCHRFPVFFKNFKSRAYDKIDFYISSN